MPKDVELEMEELKNELWYLHSRRDRTHAEEFEYTILAKHIMDKYIRPTQSEAEDDDCISTCQEVGVLRHQVENLRGEEVNDDDVYKTIQDFRKCTVEDCSGCMYEARELKSKFTIFKKGE